MTQNILKLKDIIKSVDDLYINVGNNFSTSYVNDIFMVIAKKGIKDVSVDFDEMFIITQYAIANSGKTDDINWDALKIIQEGKMDKFFGVNLHLKK